MLALALILGLLGLLTGSFASVVAHRLPRGEGIVGGRSRCPSCGARIAARDNVPVLSWLILRGRCRACGEPISVRYPLLELSTALLFAAVAIRFDGEPAQIALGCMLAATLAVITVTDLEHRIIPNRVLAAAALGWLGVSAAFEPSLLAEGLISAAAAGGLLLLVALAYPRGMGMGDVKLIGVIGLYVGSAVSVALLAGLLAGSVVGAILIARHGSGARKQTIPFGPYLALGGVLALFAGAEIVDWYAGTFFSA